LSINNGYLLFIGGNLNGSSGRCTHSQACVSDATTGLLCEKASQKRGKTMSGYRKLGRTSNQRKALLRNQVTNLLYHGKIITTEAKAKEIRKITEKLIAMAVREKDNFETVTVTQKVARKDAEGKRVKEVKDGKKVTVYDTVEKQVTKDAPSRLHVRREMLKILYPITEVPKENAGRKKNTKKVDMVDKIFTDIAPKYVDRNGGYTRIIKIGQRKGDAAMEVVIELV